MRRVRIYDSSTKQLQEFIPMDENRVGIYYCGATVQGAPHIGHLRSALAFDVIRRWLSYSGYDVTVIRNVTDIDDKILEKSSQSFAPDFVDSQMYPSGEPWYALAYRFEDKFRDDYRTLNILPPTYEPRVTANIPEIISFIEDLVSKGYAYAPGNGDVYFDAPAFTGVTGEYLEGQEPENPVKKDASDFTLWKAVKTGEPADASWTSPWGRGRPGWHIECSALALKYLGSGFDIHGGGIDLTHPHHANEILQSKAAGHDFAKYWMHNGSVTVNGEKMSKSIGNTISLAHVLESLSPNEARYYMVATHYRSSMDYSAEAALSAAKGYRKLIEFIHETKAGSHTGTTPDPAFSAAMDDDFNTAEALASLHAQHRNGRTFLKQGGSEQALEFAESIVAGLDVLGIGIDPAQEDVTSSVNESALVSGLEELRTKLRSQGNYEAADAIRSLLTQSGAVVKDSAVRA
jgi:cysteinyl-tRNA synthetase